METANYLSGDSAQPASWDEAFVWAQKIHHALVWGGCEVVCYWALFFDKKGEALIYCPGSESRDYEITPKFYTSMNYYRFVRPGMLRCTALATGRRLLVSAFRDARSPGGRAAVVVNTSPLPVRAAFPARRGETWLTYTTTEALKCRQDILRSGAVVLPGRSVTTFVHEAGARPR